MSFNSLDETKSISLWQSRSVALFEGAHNKIRESGLSMNICLTREISVCVFPVPGGPNRILTRLSLDLVFKSMNYC